jgi:hypothetical protein
LLSFELVKDCCEFLKDGVGLLQPGHFELDIGGFWEGSVIGVMVELVRTGRSVVVIGIGAVGLVVFD